MIVVAAATIYTVELLMSQATATGMHDYETLSLAVGGIWYKVGATSLFNLFYCSIACCSGGKVRLQASCRSGLPHVLPILGLARYKQ